MTDRFSLAGKTALVTGGGSGIGAAIALGMADAGARILLVGRRRALLDETLGARDGTCFDIDLAEQGAPAALCAAVRSAGHSPDIIVNAAGVNLRQHADDVDEAGWRLTLRLNLEAPFFVAQGLLPELSASGAGRIINIASTAGLKGYAYVASYCAAKHAVVGLTRALAIELARKGGTVNAICPGYVLTPIVEKQIPDTMREYDMTREEVIENVMLTRQPSKEFATVEQMGGTATFLCSHAAAQITGTTISVDGGWTAL